MSRERNSRNSGATLPIILCVAAFLLALSLALVYTGGLMIARQQKKVDQERCRQLAVSFAKQIDEQIELNEWQEVDELPTDDKDFRKFLNKFLKGESTKGSYMKEGGSDVTITLHISKREKNNNSYSGTASGKPSDWIAKAFERYDEIAVEVIAEVRKNSYSYTTKYRRLDNYPVTFSVDTGETVFVDNDNDEWYILIDGTDENDEPIQTKETQTTVNYSYDKDNPVWIYYQKLCREKGENALEENPHPSPTPYPQGGA